MIKKRITTYIQQPIEFTKGESVYLFDKNNIAYLDTISGVGSCSLGHTHKNVTNAIIHQAKQFIHCSNGFSITWQNKLADQLCNLTGMEQVFFANSGTEAVETALKCIRLFGKKRNIENPKIIVTKGAFHGRTFGALSASNKRTRKEFSPYLSGFIAVPYNDIKAITQHKNNKEIVAVLVEPIQGENGIIIPDRDYLNNLRQLCSDNNWLLALDEIQTGIGRTGKLFEYMYHKILPDILMTAKGLASGVPIGACLMRDMAINLLAPGNHGSTFGGNPLACRTASVVLDTIYSENLLENATTMGKYLLDNFKTFKFPTIKECRGFGLMLAIEMNRNCKEIVSLGIKNNILLNVTADNIVRLLPPLIINKKQCDELLEKLEKTFKQWNSSF